MMTGAGIVPRFYSQNSGVPLVPSGSNIAYVASNGNDATGVVGDESKPFADPNTADAGLSYGGVIVMKDLQYTGNITFSNATKLLLVNSSITGDITGTFLTVTGWIRDYSDYIAGNIFCSVLYMDGITWDGYTEAFIGQIRNVYFVGTGDIIDSTLGGGLDFKIFDSIFDRSGYIASGSGSIFASPSYPVVQNCLFITCEGIHKNAGFFDYWDIENCGTIQCSGPAFTGTDGFPELIKARNTRIETASGGIFDFSGTNVGNLDLSGCELVPFASSCINWTGAAGVRVNTKVKNCLFSKVLSIDVTRINTVINHNNVVNVNL